MKISKKINIILDVKLLDTAGISYFLHNLTGNN